MNERGHLKKKAELPISAENNKIANAKEVISLLKKITLDYQSQPSKEL